MTKIYNRSEEKEKRRMLRRNMPAAEGALWRRLRDRQLGGRKFRRQYSVGGFCIDFYCTELKLAIELDGESHFVDGAAERDRERQVIIESYGVTFLRFTNREVHENIERVLEAIERQGQK